MTQAGQAARRDVHSPSLPLYYAPLKPTQREYLDHFARYYSLDSDKYRCRAASHQAPVLGSQGPELALFDLFLALSSLSPSR